MNVEIPMRLRAKTFAEAFEEAWHELQPLIAQQCDAVEEMVRRHGGSAEDIAENRQWYADEARERLKRDLREAYPIGPHDNDNVVPIHGA
jgi:hypothetical protein